MFYEGDPAHFLERVIETAHPVITCVLLLSCDRKVKVELKKNTTCNAQMRIS